jgi:hypothetical protein
MLSVSRLHSNDNRIINECGAFTEKKYFVGENEVLGEHTPQCHVVYHNSHLTWVRSRGAEVGNR